MYRQIKQTCSFYNTISQCFFNSLCYLSSYEKKAGWALTQLWQSTGQMTITHGYYSCSTPPSHSHLLWHEKVHALSLTHRPLSCYHSFSWGGRSHHSASSQGGQWRNDRLGAALHKAKHLLGWRVEVKKDTPDTPPLPTWAVHHTPGKHSRTTEGKRDVRKSVWAFQLWAPSLTNASTVPFLSVHI